MIHALFRQRYFAAGLEPTTCCGRLASGHGAMIDPVDGHVVEIHHCRLCGHAIAFDATAQAIRNDYPAPRSSVEGGSTVNAINNLR